MDIQEPQEMLAVVEVIYFNKKINFLRHFQHNFKSSSTFLSSLNIKLKKRANNQTGNRT